MTVQYIHVAIYNTYAGPNTVCCTSTVLLNWFNSCSVTTVPSQYGSDELTDAAIRLPDVSTWIVSLSDSRDSYNAHCIAYKNRQNKHMTAYFDLNQNICRNFRV